MKTKRHNCNNKYNYNIRMARVSSSYLNRLKRHVCETFENPPLLQVVMAAAAARLRTATGSMGLHPPTTADDRDDPHDDQNLAANFRPLVLKPSRR